MGVQLRRGLRVNDGGDVTGHLWRLLKADYHRQETTNIATAHEERSMAQTESATADNGGRILLSTRVSSRVFNGQKQRQKECTLTCPLCNDKMIIANSNNVIAHADGARLLVPTALFHPS